MRGDAVPVKNKKGVKLMISIKSEDFKYYSNGVSTVRADIIVDSAEELPDIDDISGRILFQGSIAWDISTGDFYALTSTGEWINQSSGGENNA